jgi:hypothetical protein
VDTALARWTSVANATGSYDSTTQSSQQSASYGQGGTWSLSGTVTGSFSLSASDCFSLALQGSYGNQSFNLSSFVLSAADTLSWGGTETVTARLSASDTGTQASADTSSHTAILSLNAGHSVPQLLTVTGTDNCNLSSSFGDTLSAAETMTLTPSGTAGDSLYRAGVYAGGSFSLSSLSFSTSWTLSKVTQDSGSFTAADSSSNGYADAGTDTGANPSDSANWSRSQSYAAQDSVAASYGANDSTGLAFALTEAGTYGGGSYSLSCFVLAESGSDAGGRSDLSAASVSDSGSYTDYLVEDGYTVDNSSGTFSHSSSSTLTTVLSWQSSFSLSQQGTEVGGTWALACYAFSQQQSSTTSLSKADGTSDTFAGTDAGQTFSGTGSGASTYQEQSSVSGNLVQQGTYGNESFALTTLTYQGSGSDTFNASSSQTDSWSGSSGSMSAPSDPDATNESSTLLLGPGGSGGYGGSDSASAQEAGAGSYTEWAAGSFAAGSFSLSSFSLAGSWQGSSAETQGEQQTLNGAPSSWQQTASARESTALTQTGTMTAGAFSNSCYNYTDSGADTTTHQASGQGYQSSDTWADTHSTQQTGSGTSGSESDTAGTTFSYRQQYGGGTATNSTQQKQMGTLLSTAWACWTYAESVPRRSHAPNSLGGTLVTQMLACKTVDRNVPNFAHRGKSKFQRQRHPKGQRFRP